MGEASTHVSGRIWTVPNVLSIARLISIPIFVWLALVPEQDAAAAAVLALGGFTDYLDGVLARRWDQVTRFGQLLDPIADRLSTVTVLVVFLIRGIVPVWFVGLLILRDALLAVQMARLRRRGVTGLPVNWVGKAATFNLMLAFPLLLWGASAPQLSTQGQPGGLLDLPRLMWEAGTAGVDLMISATGWALAIWGAGLYLYSGVLYFRQARGLLQRLPAPVAGG